MKSLKKNIKVGDTVRVLKKDRDDCSSHKIGATFVVKEVHAERWLRSEKDRATGIPEDCVEIVLPEVNNNYSIY